MANTINMIPSQSGISIINVFVKEIPEQIPRPNIIYNNAFLWIFIYLLSMSLSDR